MLIPLHTDAPAYHGPWGTIGLIATNSLVFLGTAKVDPDRLAPWLLQYGEGLRPWQWLSHFFLHADFLHLLGNMVFLWSFGLVVEGKIGWRRFLAVYLLLGICQGAFEQCCTLVFDRGASLGASGAIYALLGIALVWAPANYFTCMLLIGLRIVMFEMSILNFSLFYFVIQACLVFWTKFAISSELLHLTGLAMGFGCGVFMLKRNLVDCEDYDLFKVLAGREGEKSPRKKRKARRGAKAKSTEPASKTEFLGKLECLRNMISQQQFVEAQELYSRLASSGFELPDADLLNLINGLHERQAWTDSLRWMVEFARRFPDKSARVRLKLAEILIRKESRPRQALRVLSRLPPLRDAELNRHLVSLRAQAESMRDLGTLEVETEDW